MVISLYSDAYELIFRQTNYFSDVVSIQRNTILSTFALKPLNERITICSCKARPVIHDYNYHVFSFHFQLCKIILATANCAAHVAFSHQKNKGDMRIVRQSLFSNKTEFTIRFLSLNLKSFTVIKSSHLVYLLQSFSSL